jgi:hexosaminidase
MKQSFLLLLVLSVLFFSCNQKQKLEHEISIIPQPVNIKKISGSFHTDSLNVVYMGVDHAGLFSVAMHCKSMFEPVLGHEIEIVKGTGKSGQMVLDINPDLGSEAYSLTINNNLISIIGGDAAGVFWGLQTLRQLLPPDFEKGIEMEAFEIPCVAIEDEPRFAYRGMHLDVCRHFFSVEDVKSYIDLLVMHKFNTFHWHLTEDQGWRIEIKKYPLLTEIGAYRDETVIGRNSGEYDGTPYGGFYTQEEIKDIVAYAEDRFITVIPEIEMPGHSLAALAAYPELGCTGGPYEVATKWGVFDDVYCAGNEASFKFLEDVIDEVCVLFPNSPYIHIGGDECPKNKWLECDKCQKRIKDEGLADAHELQSYFIQRMADYIESKGKRIIGWDEILEGGLASDATVMSWRGEDGGIAAAKMGHDVIMSPNEICYFDHYQSEETENEPLAIGGFTDCKEIYEWSPIPEDLNEEEAKHILGAQANVWTEYIIDLAHIEYMVLPRMAALSEVLWSQNENFDYDNFVNRLQYLMERYKSAGYNFATHLKEKE